MPSVSIDTIARLASLVAPWLLVLARASGLAWSAPGLSTQALDARSRMILAAMLTALITPLVSPGMTSPPGLVALGLACLVELIIGAGLGWSASMVIAGARQAGEIVGAQAGLSPAALFDPEAGDGMTAIGHLYGLVAMGVFLALNGPVELVRALAESYHVIPAGGSMPTIEVAEWAFGRVGMALGLALRASAAPALALTLAGLATGLLGRASPSLQLVSLSLPVRTLLGLVLALIGLGAMAASLAGVWRGSFPFGGFGDV